MGYFLAYKLGRAWVGAWVVHGCLVLVMWCGILPGLGGGEGGGGLVSLDLVIGRVLVWWGCCNLGYPNMKKF